MDSTRDLAVIVLAAGKGTRMRSELPKVLHPVLGRSSLGWVLEAVRELGATRLVTVIGHGAQQVCEALPDGIDVAVQREQNGTGDAVAVGMSPLEDFQGDVLVVNGDGALFTAQTLQEVVGRHRERSSEATLLSIAGRLEWPLGRVLAGEDDSVQRIVEMADASAEERQVPDMNAGVYLFGAAMLRELLPQLTTDNAKGELYLTDLFGLAQARGLRTLRVRGNDPDELLGINTRADLAEVEDILRRRVLTRLMESGVTISMPHTVLVEPTVRVDPDATILPGTILRGSTHVAGGATVGPDAELTDTLVGSGAKVSRSTCIQSRVAAGATVGPYAYLRPGSDLREGAKAGSFVEIKNTIVGERSKVPHLSYMGDAEIGADTNIGAGNITANYRPELGRGKQRTLIGSNVRTGSDCVLVAPLTIGDNAWTGAGSIVVNDVPAGALAIARARQSNLEGWAERVETAR